MDNNVKGTVFTVKKFIPQLNDGASIIFNGSVNAVLGTGVFSKKVAPEKLAHYVFSSISDLRVSARSGVSTNILWDIANIVVSTLR